MEYKHLKTACYLFAVALTVLLCGLAGSAQQERVFFGNLHSHTSYSDGSGTPAEAYRHARDIARLDFLALTEHNHAEAIGPDNIGIGVDATLYKGPGSAALIPVANAMTEAGRFIALYGQEYSTISSGNHVNVFDIGEVINVEKGRFDKLLDFLSMHKDSTGHPAIMMFNHPKNIVSLDAKEYGLDDFGSVSNFVSRMGAQTRLIQIINGPGQAPGDNHAPARPDEHAYFKFLRLGFKVAPTADQDNHERNWGTATPARTAVIAPTLTKASLLDALRRRHVYASEDKNLSVIIKVNGRLCGDVIAPLPAPSELAISFRITDPDEPNAEYAIRVFRGTVGGPDPKDAVVVNSAQVVFGSDGTGTIEDVAFSGEAQYFFFVVVQFNENGDEDHVWTAPVWFQSQPEEGTPVVTGGGTGTGTGTNDVSQFVASRRSNTYHVNMTCLDAQRIKPSNRVTGAAAQQGRDPHQGCPRTSGGQ